MRSYAFCFLGFFSSERNSNKIMHACGLALKTSLDLIQTNVWDGH